MKLLYYRIYYTLYRALIWLGQTHETDMIRFNVVFIQSVFTGLFALSVLGFFITVIGTTIIVNSVFQSVVFLLMIISFNAYAVFYKERYKKVEDYLASSWAKDKVKNVLLTLGFIISTVASFYGSLMYIKYTR